MKQHGLIAAAIACSALLLSSCADMMLSSDFGLDDYYNGYNSPWYYNPYGYGPLNGWGGFYGPDWPGVRPLPPYNGPTFTPRPPANGANRPNVPDSRPVISSPSGTQRPGNMGLPTFTPSSGNSQPAGNGASSSHRGR